jgi:PiT family inorganic phosphate transporter
VPDLALALAIIAALAFGLTNGFHDAANAIATIVATRVARPLPAVLMASVFNLLGPIVIGAAVADTIAKIVKVPPEEAIAVIGAGLTGAIAWNLFTWARGIPSSSSHALVGGLMGAALLASGPESVNWGPISNGHLGGVLGVLVGMAVATAAGLLLAWGIESVALRAALRARAGVTPAVRAASWATAAWLAFSHGSNDASKVVGIIAALLVASGRLTSVGDVDLTVILAASLALTVGTAFGGWSIVHTIGRRIFPLRSLDGLVSQATSASIILVASVVGAPVSTTQVVSSSVVGVGLGRGRRRHIGWPIVREISVAWLTTMPAAALIGAVALIAWRLLP